ncbi:unnamed protein product [Heterosigma akashiwo]
MRARSDQKVVVLLAAVLGVLSGYYIFSEPLKQAALEVQQEQKKNSSPRK